MVHSPALKVYLTDMVAIFSESETCNIYGPIRAKSQDCGRAKSTLKEKRTNKSNHIKDK